MSSSAQPCLDLSKGLDLRRLSMLIPRVAVFLTATATNLAMLKVKAAQLLQFIFYFPECF